MATIIQPPLHRWSYEEWDRIVELGLFAGQRVELIDGKVMDMAPQRDVHAAGVSLAFKAIWRVFEERAWVRCQLPLRLKNTSEPEPDVSVVTGGERDYIGTGHPQSALLVIEVADSSLKFDREEKAELYAAAGIADYWIVNLNDRQVEVHRKLMEDPRERLGFRYSEVMNHTLGASITPVAAKGKAVAVADLLP